ncbi:hypothetical protein [Streptomyces ipomoeae]|uniref:hypothetical protein n=1 Tax=Streptomyces ipomoeae TaxID=103232 RepID=UPI00114791FE|nr:hypothetical protein [Streptomyces ipomoeae]MDX2937818.1 hypothetical protein [Streptomyces ipomoeae]TQE27440.1 hypothetical protein SipoB123_11850 [Streptomyces ipomoeae]
MPTVYRAPHYEYEDLVNLVEGHRVVELTAMNAEIGGPGERLWMIEPGLGVPDVYRLRRNDEGEDTCWAVDREYTWDAMAWLREALADVLDRLTRPGSAKQYALEPGREERDLAVLAELEAVWLSGLSLLSEAFGFSAAEWKLRHELFIPAQAELARVKALRSRMLQEEFGTGPDAAEHAASELGWEVGEARKALGARDDYPRWVREGAAHARATIPVHRPPGDTGLPDVPAATLMTAACRYEDTVPGRPSPIPLPEELAPWYVFLRSLGACVAIEVEGVYPPGGSPWDYMHVAPVAMVLQAGWTVRDGVIVSPVPYDGHHECIYYDEEAILAGGGQPAHERSRDVRLPGRE